MPSINAVVASLDAVDEGLREYFTQGEDGRYVVNLHGFDELPSAVGLKRSKAELLDEKKKLTEQLRAFGDFTPEKIAEMQAATGKDAGKQVAELQDKLAKASEAAQREIAAAKADAEKERTAARGYFRSAEIARAVAATGADPELLEPFLSRHVDVAVSEDGRYALRVLGADGQPRIKDSHANGMTIDDLVVEFQGNPKFGGMFPSRGTSGSGASPTGTSGGVVRSISASDPVAFGMNIEGIANGTVKVG
jgi:hypothetical protein